MKKNTLYILTLAIIISAAFTSCKNSNNKEQSNSQKLTLGVMPSMDYLPLAVAQREGYFDKVGLDIKIQKFYSANERDAAFQSDHIDGCVIDFTGAILQKAGGIDLKLTSKCDAPFYIVAGKQSGVITLSDLKGKQVAVSQNTVIDFIVDMALRSVDLTNNDIKKVEINKIPVRFEMLRNGKIDVAGLPNPLAWIARKEGDKIITSNDSLGFAITGIVFHQESIDNKTKAIKKMYEAYNMGIKYLATHPVTDIKDILIKDFGFTEDLISENTQLNTYSPVSMPPHKDIEITAQWLMSKGLIKVDFDATTISDSQFIQH